MYYHLFLKILAATNWEHIQIERIQDGSKQAFSSRNIITLCVQDDNLLQVYTPPFQLARFP
jgi:hypothetical protein